MSETIRGMKRTGYCAEFRSQDVGKEVTVKLKIPVNKQFNNFLTRSGDKIMDGGKEFRFISVNTPFLHFNQLPSWRKNSEWEVEDLIRTVNILGGQITRTFTFPILGGTVSRPTDFCYGGPGIYNDTTFRQFDMAIAYANYYGVRLAVPIIDYWQFFGGIIEFAGFRGKSGDAFYTDAQIKQDFKNYLNYILNRTNYYTGVKYKDEKAIAYWELGNELSVVGENKAATGNIDKWSVEMAQYIKSVDTNHMVMDGRGPVTNNLSEEVLNSPSIDIFGPHFYIGDFKTDLRKDHAAVKGKKVLIVGEFGAYTIDHFNAINRTVIDDGITGSMMWALMGHQEAGGFFEDTKPNQFEFHFPGTNDEYETKEKITLLRGMAFEIQGKSVPPIPVPNAPVMPDVYVLGYIRWRGSTGANQYVLERAENPNGPWTVLTSNFQENSPTYAGYDDKTANPGKSYYYRVKAFNESGGSPYSNLMSVHGN